MHGDICRTIAIKKQTFCQRLIWKNFDYIQWMFQVQTDWTPGTGMVNQTNSYEGGLDSQDPPTPSLYRVLLSSDFVWFGFILRPARDWG